MTSLFLFLPPYPTVHYLSICFFPSSVEIMQPLSHLLGRISLFVATNRLTHFKALHKFTLFNQTVRLFKLRTIEITSKHECTRGCKEDFAKLRKFSSEKKIALACEKGHAGVRHLISRSFFCSCEITLRRKSFEKELGIKSDGTEYINRDLYDDL